MGPVLHVGRVFFPLDEKLALSAGSLVPSQQEHLVHLATWMPFACAGRMLHALTGVQVSEAVVRRHTHQAGHVSEEVQNEQSRNPGVCEPSLLSTPAPKHLVLSADGAMVPLVGGVWAEVRTLAIGEMEQAADQAHTTNLSYFSRMTDAMTFTDLVTGEMERRHVRHAEHVAAVMDGAEWLQAMIDGHRLDAVRILDFPHAAQRISAILETVQHAGHALPFDARSRCLHLLKHRGPRPVLRWLRHLTRSLLSLGNIREDLAYLHKQEAHMQYHHYRDAGWPIGSGMVESANKLVMQARLKGAGMHWADAHVNPMLALRNAVCNDRWSQAWVQTSSASRTQLQHDRRSQAHDRQQKAIQCFALAWARFLLPRSLVHPSQPSFAPEPPKIVDGHPTASHPWRRPWIPRSPKAEFAKK